MLRLETATVVLDHDDQVGIARREAHFDVPGLRMLDRVGNRLLADPVDGGFDPAAGTRLQAGDKQVESHGCVDTLKLVDQPLKGRADPEVIEDGGAQTSRDVMNRIAHLVDALVQGGEGGARRGCHGFEGASQRLDFQLHGRKRLAEFVVEVERETPLPLLGELHLALSQRADLTSALRQGFDPVQNRPIKQVIQGRGNGDDQNC